MTERWERVRELYLGVLDRPQGERRSWLEGASGGDEELVAEVERLLQGGEGFDEFIEPPAVEELVGSSPPAASELSGRRLGQFELIREIGRGGMGIVYLARQDELDRHVAVKVLPPNLHPSEPSVERFRREAMAASRVRHPGIAQVIAFGEHDGTYYFAMEYVDGVSLREAVDQLRDQPDTERSAALEALASPAACAHLVEKILHALHYAHSRGVVHRDIKPHNVLIDAEGNPRIVDFGLAKVSEMHSLSKTGELAGTPHYMSPEQAFSERDNIDHRTDVYSTGAVLYELLTQSRPFDGTTSAEIFYKITHRNPEPIREANPDVDPQLATICMKAMRKRPVDRYASAEEMARDLRRFLDGETIVAKPPSGWQRARHRLAEPRNAIGAVAAALLLAFAIGFLLPSGKEVDAANRKTLSVSTRAGDAELSYFARPLGDRPGESGELVEIEDASDGTISFPPESDRARIVVRDPDGGFAELYRQLLGDNDVPDIPARVCRPEDVSDGMALVPSGTVRIATPGGSNADGEEIWYEDDVQYSEFWIDRACVTIGEYAEFCAQTGYAEPDAWNAGPVERQPRSLREDWLSLPVTGIRWPDARAYAEWAGKRLPTHVEWVAAMRDCIPAEASLGELFVLGQKAQIPEWMEKPSLDDRHYLLVHPSAPGESPGFGTHGIHHPFGNIMELLESPPFLMTSEQEWHWEPSMRSMKGGFWKDPAETLEEEGPLRWVNHLPPMSYHSAAGFRCVKSVTP